MRRILVVAAALAVFGATAAAAVAATKLYSGGLAFSSDKAGTVKKPHATAYTLSVSANQPSGIRPPVQLDIKEKIYGLKVDGKDFPTCSLAKIAAAHNDNVCPKRAMFGIGYIHALLGSANDFTSAGAACDPALHVWNSGQGKLTYFFVTNNTHVCLGGSLHTGSTPPYAGTYRQSGKYFLSDVRVPPAIDYPVAGLAGSLQNEKIVFTTQSTKVHGKTAISQASVGCTKGKRPYTITITSTGGAAGPGNHTTTISNSAHC